jgi:Holliday junction resolvasome RuvABC endonuclease subunit
VIVVGVDSAEFTGLAVVDRDSEGREHLEHHGRVRIHTGADVEVAVAMLAGYQPDVVAVEEPFVHPRNPATGLALARLLGRWLQALDGRGLTAVTVPASMWQPAVLAGVTRQTRSAERKQAARTFVRQGFGIEVGEDEADAIALATFIARTATRRPGPAGHRGAETAGQQRGIVRGDIP